MERRDDPSVTPNTWAERVAANSIANPDHGNPNHQ